MRNCALSKLVTRSVSRLAMIRRLCVSAPSLFDSLRQPVDSDSEKIPDKKSAPLLHAGDCFPLFVDPGNSKTNRVLPGLCRCHEASRRLFCTANLSVNANCQHARAGKLCMKARTSYPVGLFLSARGFNRFGPWPKHATSPSSASNSSL